MDIKASSSSSSSSSSCIGSNELFQALRFFGMINCMPIVDQNKNLLTIQPGELARSDAHTCTCPSVKQVFNKLCRLASSSQRA